MDEEVKGSNQTVEERLNEYFELKDSIRTLRGDLKEIKDAHEATEALKEIMEEVKKLRDKIKNTEDIKILTDKIATTKERMDLIKEIIMAELLQTDQMEVKANGRKLKIVQVLKEMKDQEN